MQAGIGIVVVNALPWAYDWYVKQWPWAAVGSRSWAQNVRSGFVWDDNSFLTNQLSHPFHGSLYLNAARLSGYGFWGSLPFVAGGSMSWELLLENVPPSLNDVVNTTLGGMALGEATYRLGSLLVPGAGSTSAQRASPGNGSMAVGRHARGLYALLEYEYGSPFDPEATRPFDAFESSMQVGSEHGRIVRHLGISGLLARSGLRRSERGAMMLGLYQHFDYDDVPQVASSGQSLSGVLLVERRIGSRAQLRLGAHLDALLLGAVSSDQGHSLRRDYDYGPGAGVRLASALRIDGYQVFRVDGRLLWVHSVHGARADHLLRYLRLAGALPLGPWLAVGGDVGVTSRYSWYAEGPRVTRSVPETRVYLMLQ